MIFKEINGINGLLIPFNEYFNCMSSTVCSHCNKFLYADIFVSFLGITHLDCIKERINNYEEQIRKDFTEYEDSIKKRSDNDDNTWIRREIAPVIRSITFSLFKKSWVMVNEWSWIRNVIVCNIMSINESRELFYQLGMSDDTIDSSFASEDLRTNDHELRLSIVKMFCEKSVESCVKFINDRFPEKKNILMGMCFLISFIENNSDIVNSMIPYFKEIDERYNNAADIVMAINNKELCDMSEFIEYFKESINYRFIQSGVGENYKIQ